MYVPKTEKPESKAATEAEGRPSPVNYPGGNQAALSHLSAAPSPASTMSNSVIQRMIGFEFQTVGGDWNIKEEIAKENGKGTEDVTPDPHFHKQENKFAITSDGCDLEYVTDPFNEADPALLDTVELAAQTHLKILKGDYFDKIPETEDSNVYRIKKW